MSRPATRRMCEDCGEPLFFNHSVWSSDSNGHHVWHGGRLEDCERAAEALKRMPDALDAAISALNCASETAGGLIFQGDDEEYGDVARLQQALVATYTAALEGITAISNALAGDLTLAPEEAR